jgi:hypothetical protein
MACARVVKTAFLNGEPRRLRSQAQALRPYTAQNAFVAGLSASLFVNVWAFRGDEMGVNFDIVENDVESGPG